MFNILVRTTKLKNGSLLNTKIGQKNKLQSKRIARKKEHHVGTNYL